MSLATFTRLWKDSLEKLEATLTCAICCHLLKQPTLLPTCCHVFCESCIKEALASAPYCPTCKETASFQHLYTVQVPNICRMVELLSKIHQEGIFHSFLGTGGDTVGDHSTSVKQVTNTDSFLQLKRNKKRLEEWSEDTSIQQDRRSKERNQSMDIKNNKTSAKSADNEWEDFTLCILSTGLDIKQYTFLKRVIAQLGRAYLATSFHTQVTHLITGHYKVEEKVKRTMKLCMGMVSNCKILSFEWLIRCYKANDWINTLEFEMRETWIKPGPLFSHELFYLEEYKGQVPSKYELEQLITLGGGQIVTEELLLNAHTVQFIISAETDEIEMYRKYPNTVMSTRYPQQVLDRICLSSQVL
ncbi:hypothetical protein GpartN1_g4318.t1 [Galdieria partita]|uniref:RING-type E3 ubiquitin transferase BRCA1 n=1 Tax=Galdieria partita TaxID=83374 RepID=A0A9C7PZ35_9RHOD|nr:hypothetical protein GpartN1_g4318.t1 [Galdieria partita]